MTTAKRARGDRLAEVPRRHSPFGQVLYGVLWLLSRTLGVAVFGVRVRFAEPLPAEGGRLFSFSGMPLYVACFSLYDF